MRRRSARARLRVVSIQKLLEAPKQLAIGSQAEKIEPQTNSKLYESSCHDSRNPMRSRLSVLKLLNY